MAAVTNEVKAEESIERSENEETSSSQKRSKHSKKHKRKQSKKRKHKHKKHKHKRKSSSRSRSRSTSRSRSKSPQSGKNSDNDSKYFETSLINSEDFASFKLTKSVSRSRSPSPSSEKVTEDVSMSNTKSSPGQDLQKRKSRSKSKSPPFYTATDLEITEKILARGSSKSPPPPQEDLDGKTQGNFESKFKSTFCPQEDQPKTVSTSVELINGSCSAALESSAVENNDNLKSVTGYAQETTTTSIKDEPKRNRSKTPKIANKQTESRSASRSASPKRSKTKQSYSKSRSRSPRKKRDRRSRSRSSSYSKKKSRKRWSKSRSLSSRSRSRSRSPRKKSYRNRSRDYRSRSPVQRRRSRRSSSSSRGYNRRNSRHDRSYRRSQSPKGRNSKRSRSRSPHARSRRRSSRSMSPRRRGSRSPRSKKYSRRSHSRSRSRRSRSRSYSRKGKRRSKSRSRSKSKSRDRSKKRSRSLSADRSSDKKSTSTAIDTSTSTVSTAKELVGKAPTVTDPSNKRSLAQLTEFCKKLTEARGISEAVEDKVTDEGEKEKEEVEMTPSISHPFLVAPKKDITIPQVIFPVKPILPSANLFDTGKPLTEQFPVSCGTKHHEKEQEESTNEVIMDIDGAANAQPVFQQPQTQEKLDLSGLVVKRLDAQRKLQMNPNDIDAMLALQEIEMKLNSWCQSNVKPGQYTGQLVKQMMPKEKMNSGYQAWARKDMFQNLNPVSGGIGMKLLQKMGWEPGQVLGKRGEGMVEPIALTVKVDRKGLSSNTEKPVGKKSNGGKIATMDLQGKHPISLLQEYCARKKWQVPDFTLVFDEGPPHSKQFLFKVAVNGYEYQHPIVSGNKKQAKAQAAVAALKEMGLIPEDAEF